LVPVPAAGAADDGGGADRRDRRTGGGDRDLLARDPPAGQGVPALALIEQHTQDLGVAEHGAPARLAQHGAVHHPGVHHVAQVHGRRRGHPDPVQPLCGAEGEPGRQLDALQPADPLDLVLLEPAVAADREVPRDPAAHGELECGNQVIDVTELPAGRAALHGEQARGLEMPGDDGVDGVSDQGRGPHHRHRHARVGPRRAAGELLDLHQVPGHAAVRIRGERRVLLERHRVVRAGAVDHAAGHQHHAADPRGRGRGEHGLRAAHVEGPARPGVGVRGQIVVGVHQHVDAGQPPGQRRVPHVGDAPGHARDVAPVAVDRDNLLDVRRRGQPDGQRVPDAASRTGNRHNGHRLAL